PRHASSAHQAASAGFRSSHGRAASSRDARRKSVPSSPARATSWTATGRPVPERPIGRTIAGWPVRLNQTGNGEKAKTRRQYSSTSSIIISIQPSFGGRVPSPGVSSTSQRSWNAAICRPRRWAAWIARTHRAGTETRPGSVPHHAADCAPYQNLRVDAGPLLGVRNLMAIERWPEAERPRERLFWNGPEALADAELLAIQLGSGTRGRSAIDVAREMLAAYGSLAEVAARDVTELVRVAGVGPA